VLGAPKKRRDDEALRARALELRSRGLSYREIARELGCSVFKVYQLISPYESPRSRIREVHELATRLPSAILLLPNLRVRSKLPLDK
jgi:predicted transcriptional regulator